MPGLIKILSSALSNRIAAGEVVGRPESVVKELVENSIDSGASEITVIISGAGKNLVQVIDNGSGMNEDDAKMCFSRHSTSKISTYEDLEHISTLGFRGEALASICSVSQVEMKTKAVGEDLGTLIRIEGNDTKEVTKTSCESGTSISVKNLFYNTPGRRNFLKSDPTEFRHIYETFIKLAISNHDKFFKLINNDNTVFNLKPDDLQGRLSDIFTEDSVKSLIPIDSGNNLIRISGFISMPGFVKKTKPEQYFYLNGRFFTNKNLNYAVYSGYDDLIEKGNYPSFFLFIDINPEKVDVNVHPSKLEVKFEDEGAVFGFLRKAIREALGAQDLIFSVGFTPENPQIGIPKFDFKKDEGNFQKNDSVLKSVQSQFKPDSNQPRKIHSIFEASKVFQPQENIPEGKETNKNIFEHSKKSEAEFFSVWQYMNKYIMCQTETGLMILDQHAAHERILYEKAVIALDTQAPFSQQLLVPIDINLTKIDFQIALSLLEEMQNLGFNFTVTKDDIIHLTGIPSDVRIGDERKIFQELIDQYKEFELTLKLDKRDNLAKSYACKGAIKTGDKLNRDEMINLIDALFITKMPYVCPHGRPTIIRITTEELDKRFSRT
jgi:DNA mismatch repair protein MutL